MQPTPKPNSSPVTVVGTMPCSGVHQGGLSCEELVSEVQNEYRRMLDIPAERPKPQLLLCPIGLVGAGKSTVMRPLCKRLGIVRVENDAVRILLRKRGEGYGHLFHIVRKVDEVYVEQGYSLGVDSDNVREATQGFLKELALRYEMRLLWIHVIAPEPFILNKLRTHGPSELHNDSEKFVRNYFERKPMHEHLTMPFTYTFDTSLPLEPQIEEAVPLIRHAAGWN